MEKGGGVSYLEHGFVLGIHTLPRVFKNDVDKLVETLELPQEMASVVRDDGHCFVNKLLQRP